MNNTLCPASTFQYFLTSFFPFELRSLLIVIHQHGRESERDANAMHWSNFQFGKEKIIRKFPPLIFPFEFFLTTTTTKKRFKFELFSSCATCVHVHRVGVDRAHWHISFSVVTYSVMARWEKNRSTLWKCLF